MKYILKYEIKSKYFGFIREYYKSFESLKEILNFIENNQLYSWQIYKKHIINFNEVLEEKDECSSN